MIVIESHSDCQRAFCITMKAGFCSKTNATSAYLGAQYK